MSKPENQFITSVHAHLPPISRLYRMKNQGMFNSGIADSWYSGPVGDLWIEWKFIGIPARDSTKIKLDTLVSALQHEWLKERCREGRKVLLGVGSKDGGVLLPVKKIEYGMTAKDFREQLCTRKQLAEAIVTITGAHAA